MMPLPAESQAPTERRVRLEAVAPIRRDALLAALAQLPGLASVDLSSDGQALFLRYDAARLTFEDIERVLTEHEVRLPQDWQSRLHTSWCEFSDRNVYDSAHAEASCCGKPPRGG